ncbi:MAG: 2-oxo acid dehydrogenase subunit E2 [Bacteroidales bacterium]|nr:2-oxo acid dehydrogenase subunit E2 [Bacteroidales bacterium]MBN2819458.1 2-oxo acid dehydrogenase subunit E2 [Bacteroidales bacterium]
MATFDILMPKMGESIQEATITKWFKSVGDTIEEEDVLLEIATDKVDSEIPSPVDGVLAKVLFEEGALVPVGEVIAVIDLEGEGAGAEPSEKAKEETKDSKKEEPAVKEPSATEKKQVKEYSSDSGRFYSPLVKSIAAREGISQNELNSIQGTGHNNRVKKEDILDYIDNKRSGSQQAAAQPIQAKTVQAPSVTASAGDEIVKMDRMRKLIADHMVMSKQVSPHVTNFIEADLTNIVLWRNKVKEEFLKREGQKLTFMPIFIEAVAKSLKKYPGINASVDGENIILRKNVNVGIAVALPSGNLIVPVVKNADQKSLIGVTVDMNKLANDARNNKLNPDDIQGGTFTISNFGSFGNLTGTPIINQPQAAILATGTIEKKPAVIETPTGDVIAIRHKMILALTYDHRIIDGALAGGFLKYLADSLEQFDMNRAV